MRVEVKVCPGLSGRAGWHWKGTQVEPQQGIKPGPEEDVVLRRSGAPSPKSLEAWLRSPGTAPSTHITGRYLAASGIWENMRLRCFPVGSFLRTASLGVGRWLLEGPQA